jgi:hypothetical protein
MRKDIRPFYITTETALQMLNMPLWLKLSVAWQFSDDVGKLAERTFQPQRANIHTEFRVFIELFIVH